MEMLINYIDTGSGEGYTGVIEHPDGPVTQESFLKAFCHEAHEMGATPEDLKSYKCQALVEVKNGGHPTLGFIITAECPHFGNLIITGSAHTRIVRT